MNRLIPFAFILLLAAAPAPRQLPDEVNQTFTDIANALPAGQKKSVTVTVATGEKYTLEVTGTGKGIGISGAGKETKVNAGELTPPHIELPGDSGGTGGGGKKLSGSALGFEAPTSDTLWLRWLCGIAGFLIAVGGGYYEFKQANFKGVASCIAGGGILICGAIWPVFMLLAFVAALACVAAPYIMAAFRNAKTEGLLAKVGAGIDSAALAKPVIEVAKVAADPTNSSVAPDATIADVAKESIGAKMDPADKLGLETILKKYKIGKYARIV